MPKKVARLPKKRRLGRKDKADFPELGLSAIPIKIDTGAYTSAIHCHHIQVKQRGGKKGISFILLDPSHPEYKDRELFFENYRTKKVRSSNGTAEERYVIRTLIRLYDRDYPIELSLSERGEMRFPVLIGRRLLMGKFIVDPAKFDLSYNHQHPKPDKASKPSS